MPKTLAAAVAAVALACAPAALASTADAQMLALDDNNGSHVAQYDRMLDRLQPRCRQARGALTRLTWSAKRVLHYRYSNLTLLVTLWGSLPRGGARVDCAGRYAAMVVVLERPR
jgi:hypothetical protein